MQDPPTDQLRTAESDAATSETPAVEPPAAAAGLSVPERTAILEEKVKKLENPPKWKDVTKSAALVLGVLGALVALPSGLFGLVQQFGEKIRVEFSDRLKLQTDVDLDVFTLGLDLVLVNDGPKVVLMTGASAQLSVSGPDVSVPFSLSDWSCKDEDREVAFPLAIGAKDRRSLHCDLRTEWGGRVSSLFSNPAVRFLDATLTSERGWKYTHEMCFLEPQESVLSYAKEKAPIFIENATCEVFGGSVK